MDRLTRLCRIAVALLLVTPVLGGCRPQPATVPASIVFTRVPAATEGGPGRLDAIAGRVAGARPGQRIVLFARSGAWWVQPFAAEPFTTIQPDGSWRSDTHLGTEYAALLVDAAWQPPPRVDALPPVGGAVIVVSTVKGTPLPAALTAAAAAPAGGKTLLFSGYEWRVRSTSSDRGGRTNPYDPANAWTDASGALHLRIARQRERDAWMCAEVSLTRSFGYGSYAFVVRDTSHLEPAAVLGLFTWDENGADQRFREIDVEISRWGDPASQNAQYVVQPFYVPANVSRFLAPAGVLTHTFRWEPGRLSFRTVRGGDTGGGSRAVAEHVFTAGVPTPGGESVRMNLYVYGNAMKALRKEVEVVIEKFAYFP